MTIDKLQIIVIIIELRHEERQTGWRDYRDNIHRSGHWITVSRLISLEALLTLPDTYSLFSDQKLRLHTHKGKRRQKISLVSSWWWLTLYMDEVQCIKNLLTTETNIDIIVKNMSSHVKSSDDVDDMEVIIKVEKRDKGGPDKEVDFLLRKQIFSSLTYIISDLNWPSLYYTKTKDIDYIVRYGFGYFLLDSRWK